MTECEELALTMVRQEPFKTLDDAREYVRQQMPDETVTIIDNVAWALFYSTKGDTEYENNHTD